LFECSKKGCRCSHCTSKCPKCPDRPPCPPKPPGSPCPPGIRGATGATGATSTVFTDASAYAANTSGSTIAVVLGGTPISLPDAQDLGTGANLTLLN